MLSQSWTWFWSVCIWACRFRVSWLLFSTRTWRFCSDTPPPWEPWLAVSLCKLGLSSDDFSLKTRTPKGETQQLMLLAVFFFFNLQLHHFLSTSTFVQQEDVDHHLQDKVKDGGNEAPVPPRPRWLEVWKRSSSSSQASPCGSATRW